MKFFKELYNSLIRKETLYKCMAYIDDNKGGDKIVEAFEVREYSAKRAYKTAYEVLKFKYPGMGLDIRIYTH